MLLQTGQILFYAKTLYTSKHHASTKLKGETFNQDQAGMVGLVGGRGAAGEKGRKRTGTDPYMQFLISTKDTEQKVSWFAATPA